MISSVLFLLAQSSISLVVFAQKKHFSNWTMVMLIDCFQFKLRANLVSLNCMFSPLETNTTQIPN